jgi:ATP adenylyltransferase/5',5'''-P-1,P-4-tetraphosphate phosphorylase II
MHTIEGATSGGADSSRGDADPFSPEAIAKNPLLYVTKIGTDHHLLLNKFNTFPDHVWMKFMSIRFLFFSCC